MLEKAIISGVTHDTSEAKVVDHRRPRPARHRRARLPRARGRRREHRHDRPERLAERRRDISFTLPKTDVPIADADPRRGSRARSARGRVEQDPDIAKISLIGAGMKSHPGVAADMFDALAEAGINIEIISTSSIRVSCVIRASRGRARGAAVHDRFQSLRRGARRWLMRRDRRRRRDRRGRHVTLELLERARLRQRARLRVGAVGRHAGRGRHRRGGDARGARARRRRPLPLLGRHGRVARARPARRRAAARSRSTSRPPTGSSRASRSSCPR